MCSKFLLGYGNLMAIGLISTKSTCLCIDLNYIESDIVVTILDNLFRAISGIIFSKRLLAKLNKQQGIRI